MQKFYQHETKLHKYFPILYLSQSKIINDRFKTCAIQFPLCKLDINQRALHKIAENF